MATEAAKTNGATQAVPPAQARRESPLELVKRTVVDVVRGKFEQFIQNGELYLPKDYSPGNAMKAAWLVMQETKDKNGNPVLTACDRESVAAALLDMVVQGLNPIKKQCYFIAYGKHLACQRSYFGSMAVAKAVQPKIDDFAYAVVYENDVFEYGIDRGKKYVIRHEQKLENVNKANIAAAYCIALNVEGDPYRSEIMTIDEIKQAWKQSKMNPIKENGDVKDESTHGKFTADMAMKTVINKLCKAIVNASSDKSILLERMNRAEDLSDRASVEAEIEEQANTGNVIDITEKQKQPDPQEMAQAPCPDNPETTYSKAHCDKCGKREGCPSCEAEKKDEKVKGPGF